MPSAWRLDNVIAFRFDVGSMDKEESIRITPALAGKTVAGVLRERLPELTWTAAKKLVARRRVSVGGVLCVNDARRLQVGETVTVLAQSGPPAPKAEQIKIVYIDEHLAVIEKPPGLETNRRPEEKHWDERRKDRQPTLEELLTRKLRNESGKGRGARVIPVHRLDRDTSGLMLFALSEAASVRLMGMFRQHTIRRKYQAIVHGLMTDPRRIESHLIRDRGDGVRGSTAKTNDADAQHAITHVRPVERIGGRYTLIECELETGRTHQIRIHLSEAGHMLCGEKIYTRAQVGGERSKDTSGAPRHALHSTSIEFEHPMTGKAVRFESPWPADLKRWIDALRGGRAG